MAVTLHPALVLRPLREADAVALGRAVTESAEHLRPWMAWVAREPLSEAARRALIRGWEREHAAGESTILGMLAGDRVVGTCALHRRIGPRALEIGYWVHRAHVRRGLATEAVRRLCTIAFAQPSIDHVEIRHDAANVASGAVARRAGFSPAGEIEHPPAAPAESGRRLVWRLDRPA